MSIRNTIWGFSQKTCSYSTAVLTCLQFLEYRPTPTNGIWLTHKC